MQTYRTATAAAAASSVSAVSRPPAVPANSPARKRVTHAIMAMFAASESHWKATFAAMYFLLSPTVPISRLLIIMRFVLHSSRRFS